MLGISTPGDNKFCDLFAALSIPRVLNIQNLQLYILTDLTYDAKKKVVPKTLISCPKKNPPESGSGQFHFYLKRISKEGVCQI